MGGALESLQRFVVDAVTRTSPIAHDDERIVPSARGMTPAARLEVYREQFWMRHWPNLEQDYPTLAWVLGGADKLRELSTAYLLAHPPRTWDLQRLGADLPAYVVGHPLWGQDALACDAARLDWAFMETFDAPDAPPFDPRALAATSEDAWPSARIAFHPSLRLLSLGHPVHMLREAVKRGEARERPRAEPTFVVVWRDGACWQRAEAVEPSAYELMAALLRGLALGDACERVVRAAAADDESDLGQRVGGWFQHWTASGWVASVTLDRAPR